jgi:hypothetical protein
MENSNVGDPPLNATPEQKHHLQSFKRDFRKLFETVAGEASNRFVHSPELRDEIAGRM